MHHVQVDLKLGIWHHSKMKYYTRPKLPHLAGIFLALLCWINLVQPARAQIVQVIDDFNPSGVGPYNYQDGQITNVWQNWFGTAFQSLAWSTNNVGNNANAGSMQINLNFNTNNNTQFEVYDVNGIYPPVNGLAYTNFQCYVRFAPGSATTVVGGSNTFGYLQFGDEDNGSQDYFGGVLVSATNTNWVSVSLPINPASDPNLTNIYNLLIHIYGPYYESNGTNALSGTSTLWIDNIQFTGPTPATTNCVVNWTNVYQRIDGFGASSAWDGNWTTNQANMFFGTNSGTGTSLDGKTNFSFNGIGLSLLRNHIVPGGTTTEYNIMEMAQSNGARVWSTPWSPPGAFKTNIPNGSEPLDGGDFNSADNQAYANQLAGYVVSMSNQYKVNLYAISVQNEPDAAVTSYEACTWTAAQIEQFVPYLYNALVASNVGSTKIIVAEDESWQTNMYYTTMTNSTAAAEVGIVACHDYDGSPPDNIPTVLPKYDNTNAALWETEVSTFDPYDGSITNAMYWAERIHLYLTAAQVNAFHYWWLISADSANEGLADTNGVPAKRMYVFGNYSRFVLPGFYRIGVSNNAFTSVSAYKNTNSGSFAIVAINSTSNTVEQIFNLTNFNAVSVTPWITSGTLSLASQTPVALSNNYSSFTYGLPPLSVVTFVGRDYVAPPGITITNVVFNGSGLVLTWNSYAGASYSVLQTNVLAGAVPITNWNVLVTGYPSGGAANGSLSYTDTTANASVSASFYQVTSP
jgi:glucuronoarabinoxylan endo-1,4-beta-xylanase